MGTAVVAALAVATSPLDDLMYKRPHNKSCMGTKLCSSSLSGLRQYAIQYVVVIMTMQLLHFSLQTLIEATVVHELRVLTIHAFICYSCFVPNQVFGCSWLQGLRCGTLGHFFLSCAMLPSVPDIVHDYYLQLRCRKLR